MSDTLTSSEALAKAYLAAFPNPAHLIVEEIPTCGCGQKFNIYAASDAYEGVKTLDRHRKTQAALDTEIKKLHALGLKLWTPAEWEKRKGEIPEGLLATDLAAGDKASTEAEAAAPAAQE